MSDPFAHPPSHQGCCEPATCGTECPSCASLRHRLEETEAELDQYRWMFCRLQAQLTELKRTNLYYHQLAHRPGL